MTSSVLVTPSSSSSSSSTTPTSSHNDNWFQHLLQTEPHTLTHVDLTSRVYAWEALVQLFTHQCKSLETIRVDPQNVSMLIEKCRTLRIQVYVTSTRPHTLLFVPRPDGDTEYASSAYPRVHPDMFALRFWPLLQPLPHFQQDPEHSSWLTQPMHSQSHIDVSSLHGVEQFHVLKLIHTQHRCLVQLTARRSVLESILPILRTFRIYAFYDGVSNLYFSSSRPLSAPSLYDQHTKPMRMISIKKWKVLHDKKELDDYATWNEEQLTCLDLLEPLDPTHAKLFGSILYKARHRLTYVSVASKEEAIKVTNFLTLYRILYRMEPSVDTNSYRFFFRSIDVPMTTATHQLGVPLYYWDPSLQMVKAERHDPSSPLPPLSPLFHSHPDMRALSQKIQPPTHVNQILVADWSDSTLGLTLEDVIIFFHSQRSSLHVWRLPPSLAHAFIATYLERYAVLYTFKDNVLIFPFLDTSLDKKPSSSSTPHEDLE